MELEEDPPLDRVFTASSSLLKWTYYCVRLSSHLIGAVIKCALMFIYCWSTWTTLAAWITLYKPVQKPPTCAERSPHREKVVDGLSSQRSHNILKDTRPSRRFQCYDTEICIRIESIASLSVGHETTTPRALHLGRRRRRRRRQQATATIAVFRWDISLSGRRCDRRVWIVGATDGLETSWIESIEH